MSFKKSPIHGEKCADRSPFKRNNIVIAPVTLPKKRTKLTGKSLKNKKRQGLHL